MNKNNAYERIRITDLQFGQPVEFIRATGYSSERNRLDTQAVSLHVSSETNRNHKIERTPL